MLGIVVVLSVDGSNDGGTLGGILLCLFLFLVLKQVFKCVICSYYRHHIKFLKRPYSSINTLIYNDFIAFLSITVRNHPVESDTECV